MLTQLHGTDRLAADDFYAIRTLHPSLRIVNWSGDSWLHSLTSPGMLELCRRFDLQLVAAPDVLPIYKDSGVKAAFWQIGYESPVGSLPKMPHHDVVFLGNVITDKRRELFEFLRSLQGVDVGIYGDWKEANGENTYDFGAGEALYKNAKIAIADNVYPDQLNYTSNRPIQCLMAGGAVLLHQHVPKMRELLGIERDVHYTQWTDFDHLAKTIHICLLSSQKPINKHMAKMGQEYAQTHHTYAHRARQLFEELLPVRHKITY